MKSIFVKYQFLNACLIALAVLVLFIAGCSKSSNPQYKMPVSFAAAFDNSGLSSNISSVILTVSADDMGTLTKEVALENGRVNDTIDIPPGPDRLFQLDAYMDTVLIYTGSEIADVGLGEDITVIINMVPQVLMLKINPLYQDVLIPQSTENYFDIYIYNAVDLFGASCRVYFESNIINPYAVTYGHGVNGDDDFVNILDSDSLILFHIMDSNYVAITVSRMRGDDGVTASGVLARVYFNALSVGYSSLEFDPATAEMTIQSGLSDTMVTVSEPIILEHGEVVVASPEEPE